jgi:hypothetical protein
MKATLYHAQAKNILVLQAADGTINIEYPATEVRASQIAQDAGAAKVTFGRIEALVAAAHNPKK